MADADQPQGQPGPPPSGPAQPPPPPPVPGTAPAPPPPPPPPAAADRRVACPECGEVAEPGQELCLRCGARVGRTYRRPPSWRVPAALAALGILLIGAGAGFAVADLTHNNDKKTRTVVPLVPRQTTAPTTTAPTPTTTNTTPTSPGAARGVQPVPTPGGTTTSTSPGTPSVASWPKGTKAYTVVLATAPTRQKALAQAKKASGKGIPAGVLNAADYAGPTGPWVVFSGQYSSQKPAQSSAKGYAKQGFKASHAVFVKPRAGH